MSRLRFRTSPGSLPTALIALAACISTGLLHVAGASSFELPQSDPSPAAVQPPPPRTETPPPISSEMMVKEFDALWNAKEKFLLDYARLFGMKQTEITTMQKKFESDVPSDPNEIPELKALLKPSIMATEAQSFRDLASAKIDASAKSIIESIAKPKQKESDPVATGDAAGKTSDKLRSLGAWDALATENLLPFATLSNFLAENYYEKGKAKSTDDFSKKDREGKIAFLTSELTGFIKHTIEVKGKSAGLDGANIESAKSLTEQPDYQKSLKEQARKIVDTNGNPKFELPESIPQLPKDSIAKLRDRLKAANDEFNNNERDEIAEESESSRSDRLFGSVATPFLKTIFASESIPDAVTPYVKQICQEIAEPSGYQVPTGEITNIDQLEKPIRAKIKELYRQMGGFGRVLSVLGLKGYFVGIIADALVQRLARKLEPEEKDKVEQWAASLADELHGSEPGQVQQPGNVIRYPVQIPQGYTQMPYMPVVPVMPHGKWSHGAKWAGYRSTGYLMPAPGGYLVVPR